MRLVAITFAFFLVAVPDSAAAQGLVPVMCQNPQTCGTCEFVELINNVISFLITFASIAATLLIVYGGFRLVTSGGNVNTRKEATNILTNVIIGYVILLAAFLIINTILGVLLPGGSRVLGWQHIECLYPTQPVAREYDEYTARGGSSLLTGSGGEDRLEREAFFANQGVCSEDFLQEYFGPEAATAACVARGESACGAQFYSTTDRDQNNDSFSLSFMQLNVSVHEVQNCAQYGAASDFIDCPAAYEGRNYGGRIINRSLYAQCEEALVDSRCAAENAARLQQRDGWGIWSAYSANNCG